MQRRCRWAGNDWQRHRLATKGRMGAERLLDRLRNRRHAARHLDQWEGTARHGTAAPCQP